MVIARILAIAVFLIASSQAHASFALYSGIEDESPLSFTGWEKVSVIRPDGFSPVPDNPYHITITTYPIWPNIRHPIWPNIRHPIWPNIRHPIWQKIRHPIWQKIRHPIWQKIRHPIWQKITFDSSLLDDYEFAALIIDDPDGSYGFALPEGKSSFYFNGVINSAALYASGAITPTPVITPVPAPASLVLFGSALLGLSMVSRKTQC